MFLEFEWADHPVLHGLKLDLRKPDGTPYRTIVIAGENGTGKTSILTSINDLMEGNPTPTLDHAIYERNGDSYSIKPDRKYPNHGFYNRLDLKTNQTRYYQIDAHNHDPNLENDETELRYYGCIYLSARSGFKTSPITSTTTKQLDTEKNGDDEDFNYTEIKQLIVDLDEQDNHDYRERMEEALDREGIVDRSVESDIQSELRMSRFSNAFDRFFESKLVFKDIDRNNPKEKVIRFAKNNELIDIDDLSTGEKQVVFRGAYCLRNSGMLKNGIVLVDEPELSMHPKWQRKILQYYRDLFTEGSEQTAQMIITTHSDHVISEALCDRDNVKVIILKENEGTVVAYDVEECVLPKLQASEVNYLAFGLATYDYFLALYCRVQELADENGKRNTIDECDEFIQKHDLFNDDMAKPDDFKKKHYNTLPTYIRNALCHPNSTRIIGESDLERCIEFLRKICTSCGKD